MIAALEDVGHPVGSRAAATLALRSVTARSGDALARVAWSTLADAVARALMQMLGAERSLLAVVITTSADIIYIIGAHRSPLRRADALMDDSTTSDQVHGRGASAPERNGLDVVPVVGHDAVSVLPPAELSEHGVIHTSSPAVEFGDLELWLPQFASCARELVGSREEEAVLTAVDAHRDRRAERPHLDTRIPAVLLLQLRAPLPQFVVHFGAA